MDTQDYSKFPAISEGQIEGRLIKTVNARDLHAFLKVGKDFSTWIKDRIDQYGFTENVDYVIFPEIGENGKAGRKAKAYALTLDMGKELGMVERTDKGKEVRQYFINCEKQVFATPNLNDPASLRQLLLDNVEKVLALESKIEADKPKTNFYDAYINADGLYTLQNTARAINARPNLFVRWLKQKYMFYQGTALVPRVQYIQAGIFEVKSEIVDDKARPRSFVTAKGLEYFASRIPDEIKAGRAA